MILKLILNPICSKQFPDIEIYDKSKLDKLVISSNIIRILPSFRLYESVDYICLEYALSYVFPLLQEKIPIEEVFEQLKCTREGLSSEEGANRLQIFGPNKLEEKKVFYLLAVFPHKS